MDRGVKYYRHYVAHFHSDGHLGDHWEHSMLDGDGLIKELEERSSGGGYFYKILITHEITEDDYNYKKIYSIPLNQYIYYANAR